jgi:uncharacterized SAM-binding protein YcdF (DUF218 family)
MMSEVLRVFSTSSYDGAGTVQVTPLRTRPFSAKLLRRVCVPSALLVTHPWHMTRALRSFHAVGYPVIQSALHVGKIFSLSARVFFPQVAVLLDRYYVLHELFGLMCRYGNY